LPQRPDRSGEREYTDADIFISYADTDRDWAFWIGHELEALGHTPHIHGWEIRGGDDIITWMEARHSKADRILCVISGAYLDRPYSSLERRATLWAAAPGRPDLHSQFHREL